MKYCVTDDPFDEEHSGTLQLIDKPYTIIAEIIKGHEEEVIDIICKAARFEQLTKIFSSFLYDNFHIILPIILTYIKNQINKNG